MTPSPQKVHHLPSTAAGMANQQSRKGGGYVTDGEMTEVEVSSHRCSMYCSLNMRFGEGGAKGGFPAFPNFGTAKRIVSSTKTQSRIASDVVDYVLGRLLLAQHT